MTLAPNSPSGRMRHVIKVYRDSRVPFVPVHTMHISLAMMGRDAKAHTLFSETRKLGLPHDFFYQENVNPEAWAWFSDHMAAPGGEFLPKHHEYDFMIPWIARELGRLAKEVQRALVRDYTGISITSDYYAATDELFHKAPAIAMWVTQENVDIGRTSLAEALEAVKHFDAFAGQMPQGEVVYEFDDGYTLQRIWEPEQLDAEGEAMQHCVGDYCIDEGDTTQIYSLRDERGMPHVTMEYDVGDIDQGGHVVQVFGKQNDMPAPKYRPYMKKVIDRLFNGDALGLLMTGVEPSQIRFDNQKYETVDFGQYTDRLSGADFHGSTFVNCFFNAIHLENARFDKTTVVQCSFARCAMAGCSFYKADLLEANFWSADLVAASFEKATLEWVNFSLANMGMASFAHADIALRTPHDAPSDPEPTYPPTLWERIDWEGKCVLFPPNEWGKIDFRGSNLGIEHVFPIVTEDPYIIPAAVKVVKTTFRPERIENTPLAEWLQNHMSRDEDPDALRKARSRDLRRPPRHTERLSRESDDDGTEPST